MILIFQSYKPLVEAYSQLSKRRARKTDQFQKIIQPEWKWVGCRYTLFGCQCWEYQTPYKPTFFLRKWKLTRGAYILQHSSFKKIWAIAKGKHFYDQPFFASVFYFTENSNNKCILKDKDIKDYNLFCFDVSFNFKKFAIRDVVNFIRLYEVFVVHGFSLSLATT